MSPAANGTAETPVKAKCACVPCKSELPFRFPASSTAGTRRATAGRRSGGVLRSELQASLVETVMEHIAARSAAGDPCSAARAAGPVVWHGWEVAMTKMGMLPHWRSIDRSLRDGGLSRRSVLRGTAGLAAGAAAFGMLGRRASAEGGDQLRMMGLAE